MVNIVVTRRYKGLKYEQNQPAYGFAVNSGSATPIAQPNSPPGSVIIPYPDPFIFYFADTDTPTIANFDTLFAPTYGRHPRFTLILFENSLELILFENSLKSDDSENEIVKYIEPKLTVVDDVITIVTYDLSGLGLMTGYIVINK